MKTHGIGHIRKCTSKVLSRIILLGVLCGARPADAQQVTTSSTGTMQVEALALVDTAVIASRRVVAFSVTNLTVSAIRVDVACVPEGAVSACEVRDGVLAIPPGRARVVIARYSAGQRAGELGGVSVILKTRNDSVSARTAVLTRETPEELQQSRFIKSSMVLANIDVRFLRDTVQVPANSSDEFAAYFVANNTSSAVTVTLSCTRSGSVATCQPDVTSAQIPAFSELDFSITYNTGAAGTGSVTASATSSKGNGSDILNVVVQAATSPGAPIVSVSNANPGTLLDRPTCVTSGAGTAAAFQCGSAVICGSFTRWRHSVRWIRNGC
jgi:hypothetical protein